MPYSPIMSMADIFVEPHYRERDMIIDVPEPTLGTLPQPGVVPKLSRTPGRVTHAGPPLGQDTEEILRELLAHASSGDRRIAEGGGDLAEDIPLNSRNAPSHSWSSSRSAYRCRSARDRGVNEHT